MAEPRHAYPYTVRTVRMPSKKEALRACQQTDIILKQHTDLISCAWRRDTKEWVMAVVGYGSPAVWEIIDKALAPYPQVQVSPEELSKVAGKVIDQGDDVLVIPEQSSTQWWHRERVFADRTIADNFHHQVNSILDDNDGSEIGVLDVLRDDGKHMVLVMGRPSVRMLDQLEPLFGEDAILLTDEEIRQIRLTVDEDIREEMARTGKSKVNLEKVYPEPKDVVGTVPAEEQKPLFVRARHYPDKPSSKAFYAELVALVGNVMNVGIVELDRSDGQVSIVTIGFPPPEVQVWLEGAYGDNHTHLTEHEFRHVQKIMEKELQIASERRQTTIDVERQYEPTSDPAQGITLDLRTPKMKASGHGYTVSYGPDGVTMGEIGEKKAPIQKPGQPFIAYLGDVLRFREDEMILDMFDKLQGSGARPEHIREYARFTSGTHVGHLRRSEGYQFTPEAVSLLNTVMDANPTDWVKRDRSLWLEFQETFTLMDSPPIKAVWVRAPIGLDYFLSRAAQYRHANPLINVLEDERKALEYSPKPWQVVIYGCNAREYLVYEYDALKQEWQSVKQNECPQNLCKLDAPCAFCFERAQTWARWLYTVHRILNREYGIGMLEEEEKPFPEVTESWTEKKKRPTGKKHRMIERDVTESWNFRLVTFDVTAPPVMHSLSHLDENESHEVRENWITQIKGADRSKLMYEWQKFPESKRVLDPERTPRWARGGEKREITIPAFKKRVYFLDPDWKKTMVIKRVTAKKIKPEE